MKIIEIIIDNEPIDLYGYRSLDNNNQYSTQSQRIKYNRPFKVNNDIL